MFEQEYIKKYGENYLVYVHAITNSKQNKLGSLIADEHNNQYIKVYVTAIPEHGKANKAILELLASTLNVKKAQLSLFIGQTNNKKIFLLKGT